MSRVNAINEMLASHEAPVKLEDRKACVEFALAAVLAASLPLPSAPVDSVTEFYAIQCKPVVEEKLSMFAEEYPVNLVDVQTTAFQLWRRRYDFVHPQGSYTTMKLYSILPEELGELLPPSHRSMASSPICGDVAGSIAYFLERAR